MSKASEPWTIVGQGLAGTCLAWQLWWRGAPFKIIDREQRGSSRSAGGLINPVIGKNFTNSWGFAEFLDRAERFYRKVERELNDVVWQPMAIERVVFQREELAKLRKQLANPAIRRWIASPEAVLSAPTLPLTVAIHGGGRLDTAGFLDRSREFFKQSGSYACADMPIDVSKQRIIWCEGAAGLLAGRLKRHECAKGEMLTVKAQSWDESIIRVGGGGWIVPLGGQYFKLGATYDWANLDLVPTAAGLARLTELAERLRDRSFEVVEHHVGIRPIVWRSQPVIGRLPESPGWVFNGLGSKGSLYGPGVAAQLADAMIDGARIDPCLEVQGEPEHQCPDE